MCRNSNGAVDFVTAILIAYMHWDLKFSQGNMGKNRLAATIVNNFFLKNEISIPMKNEISKAKAVCSGLS